MHYRYPLANIYLAGFSTGALTSINWLDKNKDQKMVKALVSICCPVDLQRSVKQLQSSLLYRYDSLE